MKQFDVTFIQPWNGRPCKAVEVPRSSLSQNDSGETVFRYNDHYNACEVVSVVEVPQSRLNAKASYFKQYGTACE